MQATMVPCASCHAEVSDDRETCPHCGAVVIPAAALLKQAAADDFSQGLVSNLVKMEQANTHLTAQNEYLAKENARLNGENTELRKRTGADAATTSFVVEKPHTGGK